MPERDQSNNRALVTFFKFVIVAVLVLPWLVAAAIGFFFLQSSSRFNQEVAHYRSDAASLTVDNDELQASLDSTQQQLASAEYELTSVIEENEVLQQTALQQTQGGIMTMGNGNRQANLTSPTGGQLEDLALDVIVGNWGNGRIRVERLQDAGYNHSTIQQRVNEIIWGK